MLKINLSATRLYQVDLARGFACLSMPIFHTLYNLYALGLIERALTKNGFWVGYQKLGLGTFVFVSGVSFILSTQNGVRWAKLLKRIGKLAGLAALISMSTWMMFPDKFIRFGVLHFFAVCLLIAPAFKMIKYWAALPSLVILVVAWQVGNQGLYNITPLYPTGLMSERPSSIDYIPLIPWFGIFLLGMSFGYGLVGKTSSSTPKKWMIPVIWLGQHSLFFYFAHQIVIYGLLAAIAYLV
jgi:uncharacterized membrane protein